jgi:hypothetical protein
MLNFDLLGSQTQNYSFFCYSTKFTQQIKPKTPNQHIISTIDYENQQANTSTRQLGKLVLVLL